MLRARLSDSPASVFLRFLRFGALAWGGPAAQIAMIKRECVDEEGWVYGGDLPQDARRLPGDAGPRGARALRLLRAPARRASSAASSPGSASCCPASCSCSGSRSLYVEAGLAERPRRALLRARGRGRRDPRPCPGAPERHLHHRPAAGGDRDRRLRAHGVRLRELRPGPARRRRRLRAVDERAPVLARRGVRGPDADRARARRGRGDRLADRRDLPRGAEGRAADLRRRLHRDSLPPGDAPSRPRAGSPRSSSSTGSRSAASCRRRWSSSRPSSATSPGDSPAGSR